MLTPDEIAAIAEMIMNMDDAEIAKSMQRLEELAEMQELISKKYQSNPMVFSSCEIVQ